MIETETPKERLLKIAEVGKGISSMIFTIRILIAINIQREIFEPLDYSRSGELTGSVLGAASLGAAVSLFFGSALLDLTGMKFLFTSSCFTIAAGVLMVIFGGVLFDGYSVYWVLWVGMLLTGIGIGAVEASANPLIATIYPEDKQNQINRMQAWWPLGVVIGGVLGYGMNKAGLKWELQFALTIIPLVIYWIMLWGTKFPVTQRVSDNVSHKDMFRECLRPIILLWLLGMFFSGSSEHAAAYWVDLAYTPSIGMKGIIILVYISLLMFVLRYYAKPLVGRFATLNLLCVCSVVTCVGLVLMAYADTPFKAIAYSTFWGVGVAYTWPTMIATVADRYPKGGAFLMGLMGTVGTLSIYIVLPVIGRFYDYSRLQAGGGEEEIRLLTGEALRQVYYQAAKTSFLIMALVPVVLLFILLTLRLLVRKPSAQT